MDENTNENNRKTPLDAEKPSPTRTEEIGSPLIPINGVELSTPQQPPYHCSLIDVGSELDDGCGNSDAINYDSDGNGPPVTLMDSYHEEHYLVDEIDDDDPEVPKTDDIVILSDEDIKKLKGD